MIGSSNMKKVRATCLDCHWRAYLDSILDDTSHFTSWLMQVFRNG